MLQFQVERPERVHRWLFKTPYQEFAFAPVRAKYLKVRLIAAHGGGATVFGYEFQLWGIPDEAQKRGAAAR